MGKLKIKDEWRHDRTCVAKLRVHLVLITKYRRKVFTKEMLKRLREIFTETCLQMDGELLEFNGEHDHVHLLATYPAKTSLSNFIGKLKGKSSFHLRREFGRELEKKLWGVHLWSPSYCVISCGGASLEVLQEYIQNQRQV